MLVFGVTAEATLAAMITVTEPANNQSQSTDGPSVGVNGNGNSNNEQQTAPLPAAPARSQGQIQVEGNDPEAQQTGIQPSGEAIQSGITGCAASIVGSALAQGFSLAVAKWSTPETYTDVNTTDNNNVARAGGSMGWPPSLDSIGYCLINAVIDILLQSTIDWINSGFDGNPAFVENPTQFFKDIVSTETASFLQEVVGGATGLDICEPFRLQIVTGLSGSSGGYGSDSRCNLEDIKNALSSSGVDFEYNDYTSGRSNYAGNLDAWYAVSQNEASNSYGSYFLAQEELNRRLAIQGNTATLDLTMGKGFLSFKKCEPSTPRTDSAGNTTTPPPTCKTTTPGTLIENQLNNRLSSGNNRLVLADKFDQLITALVNQLIKVALNEVLGGEETSAEF